MQNLYNKVDQIDLKIKQVLQKLATLKEENLALKAENEKLRKEQELYVEKIREVDEEIAMQQADVSTDTQSNKIDIAEVKKELKQYMEEIDTCIQSLKS